MSKDTETKRVDLNKLRREAEGLLTLLKDCQGDMTTWLMPVREQLTNLQAVISLALEALPTEPSLFASCRFNRVSPRYYSDLFEISDNGDAGLRGNYIINSGERVSTKRVLKKIEKSGKRPMNHAEALRWFAANPNEHGWFVVLGATCTMGAKKTPCVLILGRIPECILVIRELGAGFSGSYRFLVVDKEVG
jgi:hypothetical protein